MHHSWLYCVGAGTLFALITFGGIAVAVGLVILMFKFWDWLASDSDDSPLYAFCSLVFIILAILGTLMCKGVIK